MAFTCPRCGSHQWGSAYNFDGPGDTPPDPRLWGLDQGQRSTRFEGTWTRFCHGYNYDHACKFSWHQRDDLKYGVPPNPTQTVTGYKV